MRGPTVRDLCSRYAQAGQLIRYGNIWALNRGIEAKKHLFKTIDFETEIEENNIIGIQSLELNRLERGEAARSGGKIRFSDAKFEENSTQKKHLKIEGI